MAYRVNEKVTNWSGSIEIKPERIYTPANLRELVDVVQTARAAGKRVKAIGSAWSFTDVLATGDYLVETKLLRGVLGACQGDQSWSMELTVRPSLPLPDQSPVLPEALRDEVRRSDRRLVHVEAGTTIRKLYQVLDARTGGRERWALPTMGGASGQTLGGAIATGTHGGDFDLPPIADMVRAIHLVGPDGSERWIERSGARAITDPARLRAAVPTVAAERVHYNDDMFDAVLVSVGALGIVYAYVIEVRAQFGLSEARRETTWSELRPHLLSGEIFTSTRCAADGDRQRWIDDHPRYRQGAAAVVPTPKGLGIMINPYRIGTNDYAAGTASDRKCWLITHAAAPTYDGRHDPPGGIGALDQAALIAHFEGAGDPVGTAAVVDRVIAALRRSEGTGGAFRLAYSVLDTTGGDDGGSTPVLSLEIAVSTREGRHVRLVDRIFELFDRIVRDRWSRGGAKFAGALNLRFTRPTSALLGMAYAEPGSDERFCYIEVIVVREVWVTGRPGPGHEGHDFTDNAMESQSELFVDEIEKATDEVGARLHWGQFSRTHRFDPDRYPRFANWRRIRAALTNNGAIRTFENDWTRRHLSPQFDAGLRAPDGRWVCAEGGGGRELVADRTARRQWETFKLIELGGDAVALRAYDGHYVCAAGGGGGLLVADKPHIRGWETFRRARVEGGGITLRAANGDYVGLDDHRRLVANREAGAAVVFAIVAAGSE